MAREIRITGHEVVPPANEFRKISALVIAVGHEIHSSIKISDCILKLRSGIDKIYK